MKLAACCSVLACGVAALVLTPKELAAQTTTRPSSLVSSAALQERRPGRWVQQAIERHQEFQALESDGEGQSDEADDSTTTPATTERNFFQELLLSVVQAVVGRINELFIGLDLLDEFGGLLGDLDASSGEASFPLNP